MVHFFPSENDVSSLQLLKIRMEKYTELLGVQQCGNKIEKRLYHIDLLTLQRVISVPYLAVVFPCLFQFSLLTQEYCRVTEHLSSVMHHVLLM